MGKITPVNDRVLIKRVESESKTSGGIFIPDSVKEKPMQGIVEAVGAGKVNKNGQISPLEVKKGNSVYFSKYAGSEISIDGEKFLIVREDEILGILEA